MRNIVIGSMLLLGLTLRAADLSFSDPAKSMPPPSWAVGQADRSPNLDVLPGFQKPPAGFGNVPFFWWLGDPLTKERLSWILEQMEGMSISGYQINYAHSHKGGQSCGLTIPSEPALFSEDWWNLVGWFKEQARKQGASVSLSDYTIALAGQGWFVDEILREHPEVAGMCLKMNEDGTVVPEKVPLSVDPMNPLLGQWWIEKFYGKFERRFPDECGKGVNYFFSDELTFGVKLQKKWLWSDRFADEFKKRKGYDITPELLSLFKDTGPRTPKIRMDYSDVMVALSEEGFFKPIYDWHQARGMTLGCDHGGRGHDVLEFGDYFRTQRWNQGPGADQHGGTQGKNDLIRPKVASSMAHLYLRPRVWLEGYHSTGWGFSPEKIVDATFANFVAGYNMLSFHGMYYSTKGGWWEWAPPDNTFRQPYWKHLRGFMQCVERLSYLMSQGYHRCDVAILYPVATAEAGLGRHTAFQDAGALWSKGIDFDFMDFQSLDRAEIVGKELHVSGEVYRVLILPGMRALRHSTLQKALAFQRAGGVVIATGALPIASDRIGRDDPEVAAMVEELFPKGATPDLLAALPSSRDYDGPGIVQHRRIGPRDLYAVYNGTNNAECFFRATGQVELWDPWTGTTRPLSVVSRTREGTRLKLPLTGTELQLIVFSPGQPHQGESGISHLKSQIALDGDWECELAPTRDNRFGDYQWPPTQELIGPEMRQLWYQEGDSTTGVWRRVTCSYGPQMLRSKTKPAGDDARPVEFSRRYVYNKNGDFVSNITGADTRPVAFSWRWGIENEILNQGYHGLKAEIYDEFLGVGKRTRKGMKYNPGIDLYEDDGTIYYITSVAAPGDMTAYIVAGELKPYKVWLNGEAVTGEAVRLKAGSNPLVLEYARPGPAYFVVSKKPDRTPPVNRWELTDKGQWKFRANNLASRWWNNANVLPFDVRPDDSKPVGWYKFEAPPGFHGMTLVARGKVEAFADGKPMKETKAGTFEMEIPSEIPVTVMMRIEQERGYYAGATIPEYIKLHCGKGRIRTGELTRNEGLVSYSGGIWYRKLVTIPAAKQVVLDLGDVAASAEVRINGQVAGVKVAPPWTFDISGMVKPGENRIEVLVCNTLGNHFIGIPTGYRSGISSGLKGPVFIEWR